MTSVGPRRSTRISSRFQPNAPDAESSRTRRSGKRQVKRNEILSSDSEDSNFCFIKPKNSAQIHSISNPPNTPSKHKPGQAPCLSESVLFEKLQSRGKDSDSSDDVIVVETPRKEKSKTRHADLGCVTPPKQRKTGENDENSPLKSPPTPSGLLERLSLNSSESGNRRQLFKSNDVYINARKALHSSCPTSLPGRETELRELRGFIRENLEERRSGTLYVSGPPGTGKTASLNLVLQEKEIASQILHVYVNCTAIKSSGSIFSRIAKDLNIKCPGKTEKDFTNAIESYFRKQHQKAVLLVLDEIDQLESKKQSVLYTIFEWPSNRSSRLILIGIANALDLTDRLLPRLQARCELKPRLMHFAPYNKKQIIEILTRRLEEAGALDIFTPVALQMLAGKVSAISGDLRRALDIARRVIEMVDKKHSSDCESVLKCVENLSEEETKKVELKEVVSVLNNVYGTTQNLNDDCEDSFPLQQKIVICCLVLILKKAKNKDVTVGRLHEVYRRVCSKRNIQVVDQGEFFGMCCLVETRGIIRVLKKKDPRLSRVALVWDESEVGKALRDKQLMAAILEDDACLGKL